MNKSLVGKGLAILVMILFVGIVLIPSTVSKIEQSPMSTFGGDILYVGGSGPGNYSSIQDAINDASDGDIVFVYDDSSPYYENVVVDKMITLVGENRDSTIIDGNRTGNVVNITADRVFISEFTIQNSGDEYIDSAIEVHSNNSCISNNSICNNEATGIHLFSSNYNIIEENLILSNKGSGIQFSNSNDNIISNNIIEKTLGNGIYLHRSDNIKIINNSFSLNLGGISSAFSNYTLITGNTLFSNDQLNAVIDIHGSECIISSNTIETDGGIGLHLFICAKTTVSKNNFINNRIDAICNYCIDPRVDTPVGPILSRNKFDGNYWNEQRTLPKPIIVGIVIYFPFVLPWIQFDWHPAQEPYDI